MAIAPLARAEEVAGAMEPGPEKTADACQDGADNDGDGRTDCRDVDCHAFSFCSEMAAPPRAWKAPLIAGAVLIPVSIILAVGSIPLWMNALDLDHPELNRHFSGKDGVQLGGGAALTVLAITAAGVGAAMLTKGINRRQKALKSAWITPTSVGATW